MPLPQKGLARIILLIFLIPIGILVVIAGISQIAPDKPPKDFLVTHNFLDLTQIDSFTKYRSCTGHRSMPQYTDEPNSSMAHYIAALQEYAGKPKTVKILAPFDGYVVSPPLAVSSGMIIVPKSSRFPWWPFNQWRINVEHAHALPEFGSIAPVKAGDLIGYADMFYKNEANRRLDIRIGVNAIPPHFKDGNGEPWKKMDSVFHYMSDQVFAEYKTAIPGLESSENFIFSREYRKDHLCKYKGSGPNFDVPPENHTIYLGFDINIKDQEKILKRSVTGPDGILNAGEECESLNNKFRADDGAMLICARQNDQMIWIDYIER